MVLPITILALTLGICFVAPAHAQNARRARAPLKEKTMRVHSLRVAGQWGADISPDGNSVAVAVLRKVVAPETNNEEAFVDVEIWDFRATKRMAQRTLEHRPASAPVTAEWGQVRYSGDGRVLLVYDGELLSVLQADTLEEITRIDLGLPAWPRDSQVVDLAMPREAAREVAVLLSWGGGRGGAVRLYDLQTGALGRQWEFDHGYPELGARVAWKPDGRKLAVSLLPVVPGVQLPKDEKTLQVMDAESGKILARINTGYLAGPICFTADDKLVTATAESAWALVLGTHKIKIWNATSERLLREIESAPSGVRESLALSADGKRLLGYVGSEKATLNLSASDPTEILEQKFRLWDLPSGRIVTTSPKILPPADKRAQLRLNAKGDFVLVFWNSVDKPVLVYEIE